MITLKSHGFKFSRPEANIVFDVSYFANPWRDEAIRNEKDREKRREMIFAFMKKQTGVKSFVWRVAALLEIYQKKFSRGEFSGCFLLLCWRIPIPRNCGNGAFRFKGNGDQN